MNTKSQQSERARKSVMTFREWYESIGISARTAYRWRDAGTAPPIVQLGENRIGIRASDADRWLAERVR